MKKKRNFVVIALVLLFSVPLILYGGGEAAEKEFDVVIGFSPATYELTDYYGQASTTLKQHLEDSGVFFDFIARAPELEADTTKHLSILEDMISMGVDYLIIGPSDHLGIVPGIKKANEKGIPVMICGFLGPLPEDTGVDVLSYFGEDNYLAGQVTGKYVWEKGYLKKGEEFAMIKAEPGLIKSEQRSSSEEIWPARGAKLVYTGYAGWELDRAHDVAQRILVGYPNVKLIHAVSSAMAMGTAQAVSAAGKTGKIHIFGFGGITSELDMIWEGLITGAGFRDAGGSGIEMAEAIIKHMKGEKVEQFHPIPIVMIDTREDIMDNIPLWQLELMDNWSEIESEMKKK